LVEKHLKNDFGESAKIELNYESINITYWKNEIKSEWSISQYGAKIQYRNLPVRRNATQLLAKQTAAPATRAAPPPPRRGGGVCQKGLAAFPRRVAPPRAADGNLPSSSACPRHREFFSVHH